MPCYSRLDQTLASKIVSVYPYNTDGPSHQGLVLLFNETNGSLKAVSETICPAVTFTCFLLLQTACAL